MAQDAELWCESAKRLAKQKKYEEAIMHFNRAIALKPKYKEAYYEKGNVLLLLGKSDEALDCFNSAVLIDTSYVEAWRNKEAVHLVRGDYDEAIKCADQIIALAPDDYKLWLDKGSLLLRLHRFRESVECFDKVLALKPNFQEAIAKKQEALQHIEKVVVKEVKRVVKKVCLLGDPSVGKTSLIRRYVYDVFDDKYLSTIGAKITKKVLTLKYQDAPDIVLTLMLWDIAGQEDFRSVHSTYFQGADGALIVCDITKKETLKNIDNWVEALLKVTDKIPIVILGNKADMVIQAVVTEKDLAEAGKRCNCNYLFTSAKTGKNVEEAFSTLSKELIASA
ncbi:MAG: tetratricopeptide repeat protein [Candidatus Thermoplasmatota archaeon]|nr:tetratricopeptide repeat protein [Candidatus Thermoplasmatota archaeon]